MSQRDVLPLGVESLPDGLDVHNAKEMRANDFDDLLATVEASIDNYLEALPGLQPREESSATKMVTARGKLTVADITKAIEVGVERQLRPVVTERAEQEQRLDAIAHDIGAMKRMCAPSCESPGSTMNRCPSV